MINSKIRIPSRCCCSTSTIWIGKLPKQRKYSRLRRDYEHRGVFMSKEFFDAIRSGDRDRVNSMISGDETLLRAKDENGVGPFSVAKYSGRNEIAALLLDKGVELDIL